MTKAESRAAATLGQWHIFTMDTPEPLATFKSYKEAVREAQCHLDTNKRPRRLHAGFYELIGETHQRDIATTEAAAIQGFAWAEQVLAANRGPRPRQLPKGRR